ncbi:MAG TPA: heterodisulfide reductase-related iron-sulfur binding cluster [Pyrinomonadaceae bacterium]|nr:heterodisulfide reductase-related iron-sulfur binding cluster [Pyrinomonadaceae bacterium]
MASNASSTLASALKAEEQKILACVHCGLCLEACPTYVATADENDGPRGRIYLMRAVEEGRLANTSPSFQTHIDRCLGCRACEAACPAGVEYGQLLEAARFEIAQTKPKRGAAYKLLRFALKHVWLRPRRLRFAFALARTVRDSGLANLLLRTSIPRELSRQFEFALALLEGSRSYQSGGSRPVSSSHPQQTATSAVLFKSCVTDGLFERVNGATARVLRANGCEVEVAPSQGCCGALHAHAGDLEGARKLARRNIDAFPDDTTPIITNAGGCGAMLTSYAHLMADDMEYADRARKFSARVRDVGQHLEAIGFRNGASIGFARTTYDASCHLLHGQRATDSSLKMLWAIPDLNFALLRDSDVCCGGAGVYNLLEPDLSREVLKEKLRHIDASGAEVLATGNAGCQMQIAAGAMLSGMPLKVCHPVELLDEAYARAGLYEKESFEL